MLKKIFPPANELTVFVFTVTLLSLFFYMDGWADKASMFLVDYVENVFNNIHQAINIIDIVRSYAALIFSPIIFVIVVFAPLFLPFNKKDLRGLCVTMIFIDVFIIVYSNGGAVSTNPSAINLFIMFYSVIWLIYTLVVARINEIDRLMDHSQTKAVPAILAATVSVVSVFIAIKVFSIHWAKAYSIGSVVTSLLFTLGSVIYFELRDKNQVISPLKSRDQTP